MTATATNLDKAINQEVLDDVWFFLNKVNERALFKMGMVDSYDGGDEPALGEDVEYFHPQITLDDRMRYIMENIVLSPHIDMDNKICNTIISHFYGARGIHQVLTRDKNPTTALVDFHRLLEDRDYEETIRENLADAADLGLPIYGTTELRTSLYGAANKYVAESRDQARNADKINILLWVASFIESGLTERMANSQSLEEIYGHLTKLPGAGQYYGYHCSTSNSVNPGIAINHDERFCVPGPGARKTLDLMFGSDCKVPYGDRVIWFRENYKEHLGEFALHPSTHNVYVDDTPIFSEEQSDLKVYGCEVGLCQYSVFHRLGANPHLANRRKVSRLDESQEAKFFQG